MFNVFNDKNSCQSVYFQCVLRGWLALPAGLKGEPLPLDTSKWMKLANGCSSVLNVTFISQLFLSHLLYLNGEVWPFTPKQECHNGLTFIKFFIYSFISTVIYLLVFINSQIYLYLLFFFFWDIFISIIVLYYLFHATCIWHWFRWYSNCQWANI